MNIIRLKNLYKTYETKSIKVQALKDINININKGEFIAIIGPSGSGKSTLLNVMGCLDSFTGEYILREENISSYGNSELAEIRNKTFGFIVQHFALINDYSIYENVQIPLEYSKLPRKLRKKKVYTILDKLKILDKVKVTPKELSGGQNQRVAIARALVNNPEIILADEPTGALDSENSKEVMSILKDLNNEGKTIILVTHDINIANQCKRQISIEDGRVVEDKFLNV